ncbi:MAG: right-handed parallel beta-helix repeat-containing protein [Candidatus Thorarchaeota archaeon]
MRKVMLTIAILFVLFCTFGSNVVFSNGRITEDSSISSQTYAPRSPMVIESNDDFVSEGWLGEGTADDPYTISFLDFTEAIDYACINMSDTTAHFLIEYCTFDTTEFAIAVSLHNVTNGVIRGCTTGVNAWGIEFYESSRIQLEYLIGYACVMMYDSWMCNVTHCYLLYAPGDGVYCNNCQDIRIEECYIAQCAANGISLHDTVDSFVIGNTLNMNWMHEVEIYGSSSNNVIYNNIIYYNPDGMSIAYDSGSMNYWDDGISIGNWWSNYGGSGTYSITGSAGSVDHYPMGHSSVVLVGHTDVQFEMNLIASIIWTAFSEVPDT